MHPFNWTRLNRNEFKIKSLHKFIPPGISNMQGNNTHAARRALSGVQSAAKAKTWLWPLGQSMTYKTHWRQGTHVRMQYWYDSKKQKPSPSQQKSTSKFQWSKPQRNTPTRVMHTLHEKKVPNLENSSLRFSSSQLYNQDFFEPRFDPCRPSNLVIIACSNLAFSSVCLPGFFWSLPA